jgi:hypothetical protein
MFASVIPRFESWHPSQPQRSLPVEFLNSEKRRHFRGLAAKGPVSDKEFWAARADGRKFRVESLLKDFSISES